MEVAPPPKNCLDPPKTHKIQTYKQIYTQSLIYMEVAPPPKNIAGNPLGKYKTTNAARI